MSIGQFGIMGGLVAAYHLNADANDFSGNARHGTGTDINYDPVTGILGPGAKFNGSSSKVTLPAALWTLAANAELSIAVVIQLPASSPGIQPILARGQVQESGDYYGFCLGVNANSIYYQRGCGYSTLYSMSATMAFESSKRYLIGLTYAHTTTGYATLYCIPLFAGTKMSQGTADMWKGDVSISAPYDQGLNLGANLRNTANQYCGLTMNEFLLFNKILPMKWYVDYAAYLRGFK